MKFSIDVRDVNGGAIVPTSINAHFEKQRPGGAPGETDHIARRLIVGDVHDLPLDDATVLFGISLAVFADETITLSEVSGRWLADSPAGVVTQQGDVVSLNITVGCISLAPTVAFPPDYGVKDNPRAALVDPGAGGAYRGVKINPEGTPETFRRFADVIELRDPAAAGWDKFRYQDVPVDLKKAGAYLLLEYGFKPAIQAGPSPHFLVAVWAPRIALGTNPQVMVMFTPPTKPVDYPVDAYPFRRAYPYSPYIGAAPSPPQTAIAVTPPYTTLPARYLLAHDREPFRIVHQLLAAGRNPIIIMPIQPSMDWGPLATQRGVSRLINEVVRFLYARQLVSTRSTPPARFSLSGGNASVIPSRRLFTEERIAREFAVTIAGFSEGIDAVLDLCSPHDFDQKLYDPVLFASPPAALLGGWREIWDIDGVAEDRPFKNPNDPDHKKVVTGSERQLSTLRGWLKTNRRTVRSYHSDYGGGSQPRGLVEDARLERLPKVPIKGVWMEQGTSGDGRVTYVHFSKTAIEDLNISDAHHTVLGTAFGHAAQFALP
jgi:hypothetical protein